MNHRDKFFLLNSNLIYWLLWKKPGKEQMWTAASPQPLWAPALQAFSVPVLFHTGRVSLCSPGWLKFTAISSQPPECWEADVCHHTQLTLYSFLLGLWICSSISLTPGPLRLKSAHGKNLLASWSHHAVSQTPCTVLTSESYPLQVCTPTMAFIQPSIYLTFFFF